MRSRVTDPPTQEATPGQGASGHGWDTREYEATPGAAGAGRYASDAEARRQLAMRERDAAVGKRRRALAALDAAGVVWRLLRIAVWTISAIIALSILFHALAANPHNSVVSTINDWAGTLAGPFAGMFILHSAKATNALDYGIAIVIYVVAAEIVINLIGAAIVPVRRRAAAGGDPVYPPAVPPPSYPQYQ
jgi:hypothetical protein